MAHVTVSRPGVLKDWCDSQVISGRYADTGDYVRDLIRRDQATAARQGAIDEGMASGISPRSLDEIMREARDRITHRGERDIGHHLGSEERVAPDAGFSPSRDKPWSPSGKSR